MLDEVKAIWGEHIRNPTPETLADLVRRYEPLARHLARKALAKAPPWQDREDIVSFAHHGLLDAIRLFDPEAGVKFETYATRRIAGAIIDQQRRMDPLTRNQRKLVKRLEAALEELESTLVRTPTEHELAEHLGVAVDDIRRAYYDRQSLQGSIEEHMELRGDEGGDHEYGLEHNHSAVTDAEVSAQLAEARDQLARRLAQLDLWKASLIAWYYIEGLGTRELAELLQLTEARCRQLRADVLRELAS